jgi:hypothetical protein
MMEVLRDIVKDSATPINNPATALHLGKPATPNKMQRPSPANLSGFCNDNNLVEPPDVDSAIKMARLGKYSYLVMNNESGRVEVKIFTPWHELNEIINQCFIRFKCANLTDTCMPAFSTTSIGTLLCGTSTPHDTFSSLFTRCNVFQKFKGDHSHLITATTIYEKIKKAITSVPSIRADMLTYEKLISSGSMDTSAMVKKADALVRT